ncbi:MAG TPA: hypothetical protein DD727_05280 [Clostridiales bacterium]|nr:hypothetical protein [Clostridiales bacterium]
MKKVLLLGDSIRISYMPLVKEKLADIAEVTGPADNCRFSAYTLWNVNAWIREAGNPDVIHWNNGIWDVFHLAPETGIFTPLEYYLYNLKRILVQLRKTGAVILWATTTPVWTPHPNLDNGEIDAYNRKALQLMQQEGIGVNDLNARVKQDPAAFISADRLHLSEEGKEVCAIQVAERIRNLPLFKE